MPRHALELTLDGPSDVVIRELWARLAGAGLPSLAAHQGSTHAPHLTLAEGERPDQPALDRASPLLTPLLPTPLLVGAPATFVGRRGQLVLHLPIDPPEPLAAAAAELRRALGDPRADEPWRPHLTLARGLSEDDLPAALAALGIAPTTVVATALRWWDPGRGEVTQLAGQPPSP